MAYSFKKFTIVRTMRKIKVMLIIMLIIFSTISLMPISMADSTHTEFETLPSTMSVLNESQIVVSIYVIPQDGKNIDSISTDLIEFSNNNLEAVSVENGTILSGESGLDLFNPGTINNTGGYIEYIFWSVGGAEVSTPGYFVNITFNTTSAGTGYVNISECEVAFDGDSSSLPTKVTSNFTVDISEQSPPVFGAPTPTNSSTVDYLDVTWQIPIEDVQGDLFNWTIECSNLQSNSSNNDINGTKKLTINNLDYSNTYTVWVNATDNGSKEWTREWFTFDTREKHIPDAPASFDAHKFNRTVVDLTWSKTNKADKTHIEWNTSSNWEIGEGTQIYNDTGESYQHTELNSGITYYYQAWSWNETDSCYSNTYSEDFERTGNNSEPVLSNENPSDGSINQDIGITSVELDISDEDEDLMDWWIEGTYVSNDNGIDSSNATISASTLTPLPYNTTIVWFVNVSDGMNWTNATYTFDTREKYVPGSPTDIEVIAINRTKLSLNWIKNNSADNTFIVYKENSYPANRSDGTTLCNTSLESYDAIGLSPGTAYYFRAWSWNETDDCFSEDYIEAFNSTFDNMPPNLNNEKPTDNSTDIDKDQFDVEIDISDPEGDLMDWWIEGQYITDESGSSEPNGTIEANLITPLPYETEIIWNVSLWDGYNWKNATYNFTVRSMISPDDLVGVEANGETNDSINISWSFSSNTDKAVVKFFNGSDWIEVYNGTELYYLHSGLDAHTSYDYRIYGWNDTDNILGGYVEVSDSTLNSLPNIPTDESPVDGSDYESVYNQYLNVTVSDPDNDQLDVYFYWGNGTSIAFTTVNSGDTASIYLPDPQRKRI